MLVYLADARNRGKVTCLTRLLVPYSCCCYMWQRCIAVVCWTLSYNCMHHKWELFALHCMPYNVILPAINRNTPNKYLHGVMY